VDKTKYTYIVHSHSVLLYPYTNFTLVYVYIDIPNKGIPIGQLVYIAKYSQVYQSNKWYRPIKAYQINYTHIISGIELLYKGILNKWYIPMLNCTNMINGIYCEIFTNSTYLI